MEENRLGRLMNNMKDQIAYYACETCDYEDSKIGMHCLQPMRAVWASELGDFEDEDNLTGSWSGKQCPRCGAGTLSNKNGDEWCSFVECTWGLI